MAEACKGAKHYSAFNIQTDRNVKRLKTEEGLKVNEMKKTFLFR